MENYLICVNTSHLGNVVCLNSSRDGGHRSIENINNNEYNKIGD